LALKLALNPDLLESLKIKLLKQIKISPLFNTELFCRNLEGAYITMWENYQNRLSVDHFTVTKAHETSFAPILPKISEEQEKIFRLHIGGKEVKQGWKIFNALSDVDVDYVGNIKDMSQFTDRSVDVIYGSHILEHVSQNEILPTLKGFYRILKNNGSLMISVPDLEVLCRLFLSEGLSKDMRFHIMRMMFGGQIDAYDFHYIGLTYEFLHDYLITAGFSNVKRVSSFGLFKDTSDFSPYGVPISLNVIAHKVTTEQNRTEQNRTQ
jgi:predicted SAM-dependent methyltransferase